MTQPELNGSVHLSMANDDRRPRFATLLTDLGYSVTEGVDEVPPQADLCILDPEGARRVADSLQDSQRSAHSARIPSLLVIYSPEDDVMAGFSEELIDDVLVAPFDRTETRYRIRTLLRSRRLSLAATTHTRRYRDLVSELSEGVFHLRQGRIEYANESGGRLLGADFEPVGRRFLDVVHPDDRADVEAAFEGQGPAGAFQTVRLVAGEGSVVRAELKGVGRSLARNGALPSQVIVRERRSQGDAREMARKRVEGTLERISDGFVAVDEDWRITYANEQAATLLGYSTGNVVGQSIWSVLPSDSNHQFEPHLEHAMSTGDAVTVTERYPPLDSWFEVNVYPAENGLSVYFRDVTERKERKRELERFETIVQAASDPIFTLDAAGRFATVNDEMIEFTGYDRDRLLGAPVTLVISEADFERAASLVDDLATTDPGGRRTIELGVSVRTGESRTCEISIALLPLDGEGGSGVVGVVHDLTDRIRREQRLSVLDRVLRHNLRNKMNVVLGCVEDILTEKARTDAVENARQIHRVAQDLLTLGEEARRFQDVLDADAGRAEVRDLVKTTSHVVEAVAAEYPTASIETDLPDSAPVRASSVIELAIEEVIENAVVHNDRDEPSVDIVGTVEADRFVLEIHDDGPGIPPQEVAVIESGTETALEHGSGLGLWLVYWTVTKYGGDVEFDGVRADDTGTIVRLWLPTVDDGEEY